MNNIKTSQCSSSGKLCKVCKKLYCSDREYETPKVTIRTYNTNNTNNMVTAQEIVEKLIDEQKISGKEAVILLNAINKPRTIPGIIRYACTPSREIPDFTELTMKED